MTTARCRRPAGCRGLAKLRLATVVALAFVAAAVGVAPLPHAAAQEQELFGVSAVHLVVDVSGSMGDPDDSGTIKLEGAKAGIVALLDGMDRTEADRRIPVGLRSYPDDGGCGINPQPDADFRAPRADIHAAVRALTQNGNTPTAAALFAAAEDLREFGATTGGVIVLVSDGESNCEGDSCEAARRIRSELGIDVKVHSIGFQISTAGRAELQCISQATGGEYRDVIDADELAASLQSLAASSISIEVEAPSMLVRSVGRGQNETVTITATVRNTSPNLAANVRVSLTVTSDRRPFVLRPVRSIGNVEAGTAQTIVWTFTPPLDFDDFDVTMDVSASAANALTVTEAVVVALRGSVRLEDAGPLLQGRENVFIVGDSYSAGEGAGNGVYPDPWDTARTPCHRSPHTYGEDLWPNRVNVACSGAVTHDIYEEQYDGLGSQLEQLETLRSDGELADLVLMTLGGNDAQFADLIKLCLTGECSDLRTVREVKASLCEETDAFFAGAGVELAPTTGCLQEGPTFHDHLDELIAGLPTELHKAYRAVDDAVNRDRFGDDAAPIVVLAYPAPLPDASRFDEVVHACTATFSLSYNEWKYVTTEYHAKLNAAVFEAVQLAQADGIPIYFAWEVADAFEPSHTICDEDRYINNFDSEGFAVMAAGALARFVSYPYVLRTGLRLPETTAAERRFKESFHPNANGYRAMTAALVEFSNNLRPEHIIDRTRDPHIDVVWPPPAGPTIALAGDGGAQLDLTRGTTTTLTVGGLQPAAPVAAFMSSTFGQVGSGYVGDDGVGRVAVMLPEDFETGDHTLFVVSAGSDGQPFTQTWPVHVDDEQPVWERWSPYAAGGAAAVALVAAATGWLSLWRRRRHQRRQLAYAN